MLCFILFRGLFEVFTIIAVFVVYLVVGLFLQSSYKWYHRNVSYFTMNRSNALVTVFRFETLKVIVSHDYWGKNISE